GGPLADANAAGETPSPEMVADSGLKEGLRPAVAVAMLAFVILGSVAIIAMNKRAMLLQLTPSGKAPEVLAERAREIIKSPGYNAAPVDYAFGFTAQEDVLTYLQDTGKAASGWDKVAALGPVGLCRR